METIGLIIIGVWLINKLFGGSSSSKGGLNTYQKYETFEKIRKRKK